MGIMEHLCFRLETTIFQVENRKENYYAYKEDGGINKDGVIELRRGVQDLSLGDSHYAQVRIMVDGKKYLKGMAKMSSNIDFLAMMQDVEL